MTRPSRFRRTPRHLLSSRGQAVALDGFRLIGERFLDASAEGVLVACDTEVGLGEEMVVSFAVPGSPLIVDAEATVVRIVEGFRPEDPGYCAGLRFTRIERRDRLALGVDLRALPPAPRHIRWGRRPAGSLPLPPSSVVLRPIMPIGT